MYIYHLCLLTYVLFSRAWIQVVVQGMIERGEGGAIVNISSMTTNVAFPEHTSYCSSKGAVDTLTRVMALELGPHQVINILDTIV